MSVDDCAECAGQEARRCSSDCGFYASPIWLSSWRSPVQTNCRSAYWVYCTATTVDRKWRHRKSSAATRSTTGTCGHSLYRVMTESFGSTCAWEPRSYGDFESSYLPQICSLSSKILLPPKNGWLRACLDNSQVWKTAFKTCRFCRL